MCTYPMHIVLLSNCYIIKICNMLEPLNIVIMTIVCSSSSSSSSIIIAIVIIDMIIIISSSSITIIIVISSSTSSSSVIIGTVGARFVQGTVASDQPRIRGRSNRQQ